MGSTSTSYKKNGWKIGTVGKAYHGVEIKLDDIDQESGEGEVRS